MKCPGFIHRPGDPAPGPGFTSPPRSFHPGFLEDHRGCSERLHALEFPGALAPLSSPPTPCHLRTYWARSRTGPKSAPRMHMGRPVWTASNHFTTISPGGRVGGEMGSEQRPGSRRGNSEVCRLLSEHHQGPAIFSLVCAGPWGTWLGVQERVQERAKGNKGWRGSLGSECRGPIGRLVPIGLGELLRVSEEGALILRCCYINVGAIKCSGAGGNGMCGRDATTMFG